MTPSACGEVTRPRIVPARAEPFDAIPEMSPPPIVSPEDFPAPRKRPRLSPGEGRATPAPGQPPAPWRVARRLPSSAHATAIVAREGARDSLAGAVGDAATRFVASVASG